MLLDLRQRVFGHFQRLSLAFHERYTSGRMISRLTSDMDAITELLDAGLDTLVTAALSIVSIGGHPARASTFRSGWCRLASFIPLLWLTRWFQRAARRPRTAGPARPSRW